MNETCSIEGNLLIKRSINPRQQEEIIPLHEISYIALDRTPRSAMLLVATGVFLLFAATWKFQFGGTIGTVGATALVLAATGFVAWWWYSGSARIDVRSSGGKITLHARLGQTAHLDALCTALREYLDKPGRIA